MEQNLNDRMTLRSQVLSPAIMRVSLFPRDGSPDTGLNRYGFLNEYAGGADVAESSQTDRRTIQTDKIKLTTSGNEAVSLRLEETQGAGLLVGSVTNQADGTFSLKFDLAEDEKLFGLGDHGREQIQRRGCKAVMKVTNVFSYIPIPLILSSRGYGILINTTRCHGWDVGATLPDKLHVLVPGPSVDVYLLYGPGLKDLLTTYTELTGRPVLPPKWSFGLWFICRTQANDHEVTNNAMNFRDRQIPCDVIGLEPGWMDNGLVDYDMTVDKKWCKERFPIPDYAPNGPYNFINALKRMGYKLELWMCTDYDLSYEAERSIGNDIVSSDDAMARFYPDDFEQDANFLFPVRLDKCTRPEEPWFEHLKKFVDQGADFFKQDGAFQVNDHPDRLWGNGTNDEEMHNLYPLLYSQQMYEGFKGHTGRRPCCFTDAGWAGLQRYTGTWAGDTGGDGRTLVACLNLALSGHSLVTCDMEVTSKEGIHYGFLMPWAHVNSWNYFRHPWLQGDELYQTFCEYARLRSRLVPYLYTYAHVAHTTGIPMMRPMVLEHPSDPNAATIVTQWFLGNELLVSSFAEEIYLPEGRWYDYWTGRMYNGPKDIALELPKQKGGGLFVRANSIIPWGPVVQYVGQETEEGMRLEVFLEPEGRADFMLYDDDGVSFEYEQGKFATYHLQATRLGDEFAVHFPKGLHVDCVIAHLDTQPCRVAVNGCETLGNWSPDEHRLEILLRS